MGLTFSGHAILTGRTGQTLWFALSMSTIFVVIGISLAFVQYRWRRSVGRVNRPG